MNKDRLNDYHEAAKMIEVDGVEAYRSVSAKFGEEMANTLIVAFVRMSLGSMDSFPPRKEIIEETNKILSDNNII